MSGASRAKWVCNGVALPFVFNVDRLAVQSIRVSSRRIEILRVLALQILRIRSLLVCSYVYMLRSPWVYVVGESAAISAVLAGLARC